MIPNRYMSATEWAHLAWQQNPQSPGLTIPADALVSLLTRIFELSDVQAALDQRLKITIETDPPSPR